MFVLYIVYKLHWVCHFRAQSVHVMVVARIPHPAINATELGYGQECTSVIAWRGMWDVSEGMEHGRACIDL